LCSDAGEGGKIISGYGPVEGHAEGVEDEFGSFGTDAVDGLEEKKRPLSVIDSAPGGTRFRAGGEEGVAGFEVVGEDGEAGMGGFGEGGGGDDGDACELD
jgi:hypothetical protein